MVIERKIVLLRGERVMLDADEIMRAFVRLRRLLATNADLARRLAILERRHDAKFRLVFDAIRDLMAPPKNAKRAIGFRP